MQTTRCLDNIPDSQAYLGGIGRTTLYELAKQGEIQLVNIGRRAFITRESLDAYVVRLATGSPPGDTHSTASGGTTSPRTGSQLRPAGGDR